MMNKTSILALLILLPVSSLTGVGGLMTSGQIIIENEAPDLGLLLNWVVWEGQNLSLSSYGTFDLLSNDGSEELEFSLNISGFTLWDDIYNITGRSNNSHTEEIPTAGQLMMVIDNKILNLNRFALWDAGFSYVFEKGDHTVTFLHMNIRGDGTFLHVSESFTVRVRSSETFGPYEVTQFKLDYQVEDNATGEGLTWEEFTPVNRIDEGWTKDSVASTNGYVKNNSMVPPMNITTETSGRTLKNLEMWSDMNVSQPITLTGSTDSTGSISSSISFQHKDQNITDHPATRGRVFILDAMGLQEVSDDITISLRNSKEKTEIFTFLGVLAIADGGIFYFGNGDLEAIDVIDKTSMGFSFDFLTAIDGTFISIPSYLGTTTISSEDSVSLPHGFVELILLLFVIRNVPKRKKLASRR